MNCDRCLLYVTGLLVTFAYDDISYHKVATQSKSYIGQQYEAKSAVDRNTQSCMRTEAIGTSSPEKTMWWKVDLGGVYNIYSINILFKNYDGFVERQRGRFAGFSMYVSDLNVLSNADIKGSTLCYKDGPELPFLNFTTVCTEMGRYVIYYNERLKEVIYPKGYEVENVFTELCEVIVQGCNNAGFYGSNCDIPCPMNCKDNTCHIQNGTCFACKPGWTGVYCDTKCREGLHGMNCSQQCVGRCRDGVTCHHVTGNCGEGCDAGWTGIFCNKECNDGTYGYNCVDNCSGHCLNDSSCNKQTGHCDKGCSPGYTTDNCSKVCPSEHFGKNCTESCSGLCINNEPCDHVSGVCPMGCQDGYTGARLLADDIVESTYALPEKTKRGPPTNKNIPRGELHPCLEGKKQENKAKNRYTTIFPYDHSRVILNTAASDEGGYINANYIEDTRERRTYIATQGPKPKTIADFWNMIWQEEVCSVVCLTNLTEGTKNKCAQYWPDINDKLQGGTLTVRHLEEKTYAEYIIRRFKIHNKSTRTARQVTMFHYTTWSDHGVADPLSLVVFHRHVIRATANSAGKYTVVHCSAGVGRTGTYIALDALYREGERTGKINVPMYVRTMRKDRMNMIQGDDQYRLLYLALKDAFSGRSKCLKTEKFLSHYQGQSCYTNCGDVEQRKFYSSDLEELLFLRKEYTQQDYISGRAQISANYTESVLPVEEFLCRLSYIKGHNTYYNAVLIQSYLEKDSLISAQYPLPDNTEDFLRLVKDFDARVVVFLCPLKDIESTSKWYPSEGQTKFDGMFYIKNLSSTKASNVTINRLNIQPTGFNQMEITVLECPKWSEKHRTSDKRILLDVTKAVKTEKTNEKGRVLVLSRDGATRCGPFFVVYNVLEQISVDREVDIFTAVRQIQIRRPECVSTVEEYELCHDALAEYLLNDSVYGNC